MTQAEGRAFEVGDDALYRVRDDLWLPCKVINVTRKRIVVRPHGRYTSHRNTVASQLRHVGTEKKGSVK